VIVKTTGTQIHLNKALEVLVKNTGTGIASMFKRYC